MESHIAFQQSTTSRHPMDTPPELWLEIFMLSLPLLHLAQAPQRAALACVCRSWNAIVQSSPTLWSGISINDKIGHIQRSLLKSRESPIDIYGGCRYAMRCLGDDVCCQFMREVNRHARRWRHVTLHIVPTKGYAPSYNLFPSLQSLTLISIKGVPTGEEYIALLDSSQTPYLRELFLVRPQLAHWNISPSANLSKLAITHSLISSSELLSILKDCPNLAILRLLFSKAVSSRADSAPVVELAALQELELCNTSVFFAGSLLQRLRIPDDCAITLKLRARAATGSRFVWNHPLLLYHERFRRASQIDPMTITADAKSIRGAQISIVGCRCNVELNLNSLDRIKDALEWLGINTESNDGASHFGPPPVDLIAPNSRQIATLELWPEDTYDNIDFRNLAPIFSLQCITKIKATSFHHSRPLMDLISYLSKPQSRIHPSVTTRSALSSDNGGAENDPSKAWSVPNLRELVMEVPKYDEVWKAVIDLVEGRSGEHIPSEVLGNPAHLKRIEFMDKSDDVSIMYKDAREDGIGLHLEKGEWKRLVQLLEFMDDDAELFWRGLRISGNGEGTKG
ncbi:hypothetical protein FRC01_000877 [Tulasnella sp. 417]|nr:hypothetical protein FRC01_000877 [Tulasnella sp. 417]